MPVHVSINPKSVHALTSGAEAILREAIGDRSGEWNVFILEISPTSEYVITMDGPGDFLWRRKFHGPHEQTLEFIRNKIRETLPSCASPAFPALTSMRKVHATRQIARSSRLKAMRPV